MYQNGPTNTSPDDEPRLSEDDKIRWAVQRAHCESNAKLEALWLHRPAKVLRIVACVALLCCALTGCGGGSAEAPPTNAVGIGGTVFTRDSGGRPLAVDLTVVVTGQGVKPVGGR